MVLLKHQSSEGPNVMCSAANKRITAGRMSSTDAQALALIVICRDEGAHFNNTKIGIRKLLTSYKYAQG